MSFPLDEACMPCACLVQVRVVDVQEGKVVSSSSSTLARGVLPLTAAATEWLAAAGHHTEATRTTRVKVCHRHMSDMDEGGGDKQPERPGVPSGQ